MDIRKADNKGRVSGFKPGLLYAFDRETGYFSHVALATSDGTLIEDAIREAIAQTDRKENRA